MTATAATQKTNAHTRSPVLPLRGPVTPGCRLDRFRGAVVGMAVGDALGATVEFKPRGTFPPPTELAGGGPFRLKPGEWTDDTSQALCLAESLLACRKLDPRDAMARLVRWMDHGHLSVNGRCFDIGSSASSSLRGFKRTGEPFQGKPERTTNGSIMRLAPVPLAYSGSFRRAMRASGVQARLTHGGDAVGAAQFLGYLIAVLVAGNDKETVLGLNTSHGGLVAELPHSIQKIAGGSYRTGKVHAGYGAAECLNAALWVVHAGESFEDAVCKAANLGDDADTVGAVAGQLAGAIYGYSGIPQRWKDAVAWHEWLVEQADLLYDLAVEIECGGQDVL